MEFIIALRKSAEAEKPVKAKKEHRIEIEKDKEGRQLKVKFLSADGKVIKTLPPEKAIVSKNGKSLIYKSGYYESPEHSYEKYERKLLNAEGEVEWQKSWKNYPEYGVDPKAGFSGWFEGIADNGERIYVTYRSTDGVYNLVVLDANGAEIAKAANSEMLWDIEISPDGKIIGAKTSQILSGRHVQHLFFLEVDTGETKLVKAQGEGWIGRFLVKFGNSKPFSQGKIYLNVTLKNKYTMVNSFKVKKTFRGYFKFNELPNDMSELIQEEK